MQQINLYPVELQPKNEWLTARSLAMVLIGLIILLFISYIRINIHQKRVELNVSELEAEYVSAVARIDRIKGNANPSTTQNLENIQANLREKISQRRNLSQIIESQNLGNEVGFSGTMMVIAQESLATISLQRIKINADKKLVELSGLCKKPRDIPKYVDSLSRDPAFKSLGFGALSISQDFIEKRDMNSNSNLHKFSVGFESVYQLAEGNQ